MEAGERSPVPAALSVSEQDLEGISDAELASLEDRLLLDSELDLSPGAQFTAGRVVVWMLTILGVVLALALLSRLPLQRLGPLGIPLYLGAIGAGAAGAHLLWSKAGRQVRESVRWFLGHWPLLLYAAALVYRWGHPG